MPAAALVLALAFLLLPQVWALAALAPAQSQQVRIAISKDAFWYRPGDTAKLRLTLDNLTRQTLKGVSVRVRIHARTALRASLDSSFEVGPAKSYKQTDTFGPLTLSSGNNSFEFELELKASRFTNGVYPMTVEVVRSGNVVSNANSELVVMSVSETQPPQSPLRLSLVFDTLEPAHRDPTGVFSSDELATECSSAGKSPGWYPTLLEEMEKWQSMRFSLSLSPMLFEDMLAMSNGYLVKRGKQEQKVAPDSAQATSAGAVLNGFRKLVQSDRYQLLPEPYASPDLETLVSLRWRSDAVDQLNRGRRQLEEILVSDLSNEYSSPPGLKANSRVISELGDDMGRNLVLSARLLERSREGRKLTEGATLGSPVSIDGRTGDGKELALFADARMQELLKRVNPSEDPHGVAQVILAELTNLYLERPAAQRACVVVAPGWWHPSKDVLDELMRALSGAPWLKSVTLADCFKSLRPASETTLKIPEPEPGQVPNEYFQQVGLARNKYDDFHTMVVPGNPLPALLQRDVYSSESDVWSEWDIKAQGLGYATFVSSTVDGELAKVDMPAVGSITLTSSKAKIPLSVVNGTGYRIKAVLQCSSNGLTFPEGDEQKVLLEPKENLLEIPVKVRKKGRVRFSARLKAEDLTIGELNFSVLTSRFNTFAILLVGGLLALIGVVWASRIISRRKVGKHKRRQLKGAREGKRTYAES